MAEAHPIPKNPRFINIIGRRFGKWCVLSYAGARGPTQYFVCRCKCGIEKEVAGESLKRGLSTCCRRCAFRVPMRPVIKHGLCDSIEYNSWKAMMQRCHNKANKDYPYYGRRGIKVCDRWRRSFQVFLNDMGKRPSIAYTIDRFPDVDGNYEPGNCRWATHMQQMRNTRRNKSYSKKKIVAS